MLRAGKKPSRAALAEHEYPRTPGVDLPVKRTAGIPITADWRALGHRDLVDVVRRIYTLCGWEQVAPGPGQTLAIASAVRREGKSSLARALAIAVAQDHDADVLLLECDLLQPKLSHDFGVLPGPGLTEVLAGEATLTDGLRRSRIPNLWLLPAGSPHESPSRLLRSLAMQTVLSEARDRFAFTVMDLPAVLESSDAAVLARQTDGVVLVVRAGSTNQRSVQQAIQLLSGVPLHGVVLNRRRSRVPGLIRRLMGM